MFESKRFAFSIVTGPFSTIPFSHLLIWPFFHPCMKISPVYPTTLYICLIYKWREVILLPHYVTLQHLGEWCIKGWECKGGKMAKSKGGKRVWWEYDLYSSPPCLCSTIIITNCPQSKLQTIQQANAWAWATPNALMSGYVANENNLWPEDPKFELRSTYARKKMRPQNNHKLMFFNIPCTPNFWA